MKIEDRLVSDSLYGEFSTVFLHYSDLFTLSPCLDSTVLR